MGRYTQKMTDTLDAIALRKYVLSLPREEYLFYINDHPTFRSTDSQSHSDADLLTMKAIQESFGSEAGITWAEKRRWQSIDKAWRADNLASATSRYDAFGFTLLFNGAKYGAVLAVAYIAMPPIYFAAFLPVFSVIVLCLAVCGALLRRVL